MCVNKQKRFNMNIELRFLEKAILDKNFVSFKYEGKSYKKLKPLKLEKQEVLHTDNGIFEFSKVVKFSVLKDRF